MISIIQFPLTFTAHYPRRDVELTSAGWRAADANAGWHWGAGRLLLQRATRLIEHGLGVMFNRTAWTPGRTFTDVVVPVRVNAIANGLSEDVLRTTLLSAPGGDMALLYPSELRSLVAALLPQASRSLPLRVGSTRLGRRPALLH